MSLALKAGFVVATLALVPAAAMAQLESRDRGAADPLLRDMVVAMDYPATFRVDLPPGSYTVNVTMGDPSFAQGPMNLAVQGQVVASGFSTSAGSFFQRSYPVTITTAPLTVTFSSAAAKYWVLNALTVVQDSTPIRRFDFQPEGSPLAPGYEEVGPQSEYDPGIGFGWPIDPTEVLAHIKVPDTEAPGFPTQADYMIALERFPLYGERGWVPGVNGQPGYFGGSEEAELSMRSMGNYIFTYAVLAVDPAYDASVTSVPQGLLLSRVRECLMHMTRSHVTGDITRPNGKKWGNHWQSAWWATRMVAGARVIWDQLNATERSEVRRVVVHEANRHLNRNAPNGVVNDTKSEENAWDAEVLAWASAMFPDHTNAAAWLAKAKDFNMNTLSIPADNTSTTMVDGRTVGDWVYTANIHPDYTIENHGSYHFCYMACPLHSAAWSYYGYLANSATPPQTLLHHLRDVYERITDTWLGDGRFAYMSGKDWPRYAYGLYFIQPALGMLQNVDNDQRARLMERERFRLFEWESRQNRDGTFFGKRFTSNVFNGRLLEYETDCAANLALTYMLHKLKPAPPAADREAFLTSEATSFAGGPVQTAYTRDETWFASWSWKSLSRRASLGLVVPLAASDLAEWGEDNLLSSFQVKGQSAAPARTVSWSKQNSLPGNGGITAIGVQTYTHATTATIRRETAFAAITPLHRAVMFDRLSALQPVTLSAVAGPRLFFANDIFNGNSRSIQAAGTSHTLRGVGGALQPLNLSSRWLNIDNQLGVAKVLPHGAAGSGVFSIADTGARNAPFNSLCFETALLDVDSQERTYAAGEVIRDSTVVVGCGEASTTDWLANSPDLARLPSQLPDVVVVLVPGENGRSYIVGANFGWMSYNYQWTVPAASALKVPSVGFLIPGESVVVVEVASEQRNSTVADHSLYDVVVRGPEQ